MKSKKAVKTMFVFCKTIVFRSIIRINWKILSIEIDRVSLYHKNNSNENCPNPFGIFLAYCIKFAAGIRGGV